MIKKSDIIPLLKILINDLVDEKYKHIEDTGRIWRGTAQEIKDCIEKYPGKITLPPEDFFSEFEKYDFNTDPDGCEIDFILWVDNKKSDLTLSAEIRRDGNNMYSIKIVDIRVL